MRGTESRTPPRSSDLLQRARTSWVLRHDQSLGGPAEAVSRDALDDVVERDLDVLAMARPGGSVAEVAVEQPAAEVEDEPAEDVQEVDLAESVLGRDPSIPPGS